MSKQRSPAWSAEEIERQYQLSNIFRPLAPGQVVQLGALDWALVEERGQGHCRPPQRVYALPLDERYYLTFEFRYDLDHFDNNHRWLKAARKIEQQIMASVTLTPIPEAERADARSETSTKLALPTVL